MKDAAIKETASKNTVAKKADNTIQRDEWVLEMGKKSPSPEACQAYVELEQFLIARTPLKVSYRRIQRGKSHHATFNASVLGKCTLIEILDGRCELVWKCTKPIAGLTTEQQDAVNAAYERFRVTLGGADKSYERYKVVKNGVVRVQDALLAISADLHKIME